MRTELVLFDFDGTLVDTAPDLIRAVNLFLEREGLDALSEELIRSQIGSGLRRLLHSVFPQENLDDIQRRKIEGEFLAIYERELLVSPKLNPGALDFLLTWDRRMGILSNKRLRHIQPILKHLGIDKLSWTCVIGGDSYENMKPHPQPFIEAMTMAGVTAEETTLIGDGIPDVVGAVEVGCRCIAVEFGYYPTRSLLDLGAEGPISSFDELFAVL